MTLVVVSRAPLAEIEAYKKRMGWKFKWVSSYGSDFNRDFHVSFSKDELAAGEVEYNYAKSKMTMEELPGISAFIKDGGAVFHTYSSYARGLDTLVGSLQFPRLGAEGPRRGRACPGRWPGYAGMTNMRPHRSHAAAARRADNQRGSDMHIAITALYAGILALFVVALGMNVTRHRVKLQVPLGDGGNPEMLRMIRLHGNAIEYIPLAVLLMLIYEINGGWPLAMHAAGIALVVGRILQTWGMWGTEIPSFGRGAGQTLTWVSIAALAVLNLWKIV